jgi:hypothetical protein
VHCDAARIYLSCHGIAQAVNEGKEGIDATSKGDARSDRPAP